MEFTKVFIRVDIMVIFLGYDGNIYIYTQQYDILENNLGGNGVYQCFPESQTTHFTISYPA
jgi:hypothetical protein